jgi:hypothetical protein
MGETMTCILKGAFKKASHNLNEGCPKLLCGGGFVTNPLCDVCFGGPPEIPFTEKGFVIHFGIC